MNKKRLFTFLVSLGIFLIFILTTSPYHMPLLFIVIPGIAFIVAIRTLLTVAIGYVPVRPKVGHSIVHLLTVTLSVVAILLSVGQLTFRDFGFLLALALVGMFYLSRMLDK